VVAGDSSFLIREALERVFASLPAVELVAIEADGDSVLARAERSAADVVLVDVDMPPSGSAEGLRIAARLRAENLPIAVIVCTQVAEPADVVALFEHGAAGRGYLLKERIGSAEELSLAIETVAAGGSVVDPAVVDLVLGTHDVLAAPRSRLAGLTPREREVLAAMAQGKSNRAIASELVLSQHAVEKYVGSIFRKLELLEEETVSRRVAAVLVYLEAVHDRH
jgi:DNA-binding NarL/FixJ family response regulator